MPCLLCLSLLCCLLLLLPFSFASGSASNGDPVITTSSGPIKGKQFQSYLGSVTAYLGIPYAKPPVGNLRFQKPLPHPPWTQTLEATSFGNSCSQFILGDSPDSDIWTPKTPLSEDCLSLNIWVPHPQPSSPLPVLVWIHGGGFFFGAGSLDVFNGAPLAAAEKVIVVTMNYRLGVLGFMYMPPAAPGNLGLWDQQLALKWVKENAAAFGGDPSRVTLFGQSAGASCVNLHLLAPKSQDYFAQAVIQSGTANAFWASKSAEEAKQKTLEFVLLLGCFKFDTVSILHCLQSKNVSELIQQSKVMFLKYSIFFDFPFEPTVDGDFLPGDPGKLMEEGKIQVKPVIIGENPDEMARFIYSIFYNNNNSINQEGVPNAIEDLIRTIALRYIVGNDSPAKYSSVLVQLLTDLAFACPIRETAGNMRKSGCPLYAYVFAHRPSWSVWPEWVRATHTDEIPFVFGTLRSMLPFNQTCTEAEARLSRRMMYYWAEFARTGNPNGLAASQDEWPLYNAEEQNFFILTIEPFEERPKEHCDLLNILL